MGGGADRQASMVETKVISGRSVSHPHDLPALLESEDDERERKRGESRKRVMGRQKSTQNVNESIGNLTIQSETGRRAHTHTSIRPAGGRPLQCSPKPTSRAEE